MKKCLCSLASLLLMTLTISAQEVKFEEYDLSNGMHVILHQDNTAPVVTTSVMYHVGAKDENQLSYVLATYSSKDPKIKKFGTHLKKQLEISIKKKMHFTKVKRKNSLIILRRKKN